MKYVEIVITNTWFAGIVTGLVVALISDKIAQFRGKREYLNRLSLASNELLNTLKMVIPEKDLPNKEILLSLHKATAVKYDVKTKDMDTLATILDNLVKEIMDSSFLNYEDKISYCSEVNELKNELLIVEESLVEPETEVSKYYEVMIRHQRRTVLVLSSPIIAFVYVQIYNLFSGEGLNVNTLIKVASLCLVFMLTFVLIKQSSKIMKRNLKEKV